MFKSILMKISLLCGFLVFSLQAKAACPDVYLQINCSKTNCKDLNLSYGLCPNGLSLLNASETNVALRIPLTFNNSGACISNCYNVVIKRGNSSDYCSMQHISSSYIATPAYPTPGPLIRIDVMNAVTESGNFTCRVDPNNNAHTALRIQPK